MIFRDKSKAEAYASKLTELTNSTHVPIEIKEGNYNWLVLKQEDVVRLALGDSTTKLNINPDSDFIIVHDIINRKRKEWLNCTGLLGEK